MVALKGKERGLESKRDRENRAVITWFKVLRERKRDLSV